MHANITCNLADDQDHNPEEEEEKQRLIGQILELQNTLDGTAER